MALQVQYLPYKLHFKFEAGTSRGTMTERDTWFVRIYDADTPTHFGIGECAPLQGLSLEANDNFEPTLQAICQEFNQLDLEIFSWNIPIILEQLIDKNLSSIRCGFEMAMLDYLQEQKCVVFDNDFVGSQRKLPINGLIWMGTKEQMLQQVEERINAGFTTLKLKVGAIDFEQECAILQHIRQRFSAQDITLRLDANGAFASDVALEKLEQLAVFDIHSIEQPIKHKNIELMAELCQKSPIAIALDEELIGTFDYAAKRRLLKTIQPKYIILKPTLLCGFEQTKEWIETAQRLEIGWWITSALESNIGLNAIAQFTAEFNNPLPQGLGTGKLYHNNISSPLEIVDGYIRHNAANAWDLSIFDAHSDAVIA